MGWGDDNTHSNQKITCRHVYGPLCVVKFRVWWSLGSGVWGYVRVLYLLTSYLHEGHQKSKQEQEKVAAKRQWTVTACVDAGQPMCVLLPFNTKMRINMLVPGMIYSRTWRRTEIANWKPTLSCIARACYFDWIIAGRTLFVPVKAKAMISGTDPQEVQINVPGITDGCTSVMFWS